MPKLTLTDLTNLANEQSVVNAINNNNAAIETALENTLSRDGTTPNTMSADLDMNSNQIINLPAATTDTEPVRKAEFDDAIDNIATKNLAMSEEGIVVYINELGATAREFVAAPGSGITITNGDGVDGNPTFDFDSDTIEFAPAIDALVPLEIEADRIAYYTSETGADLTPLTSFGRSLIDDANASAARSTLGLVIGEDVQAQDAELSAIAGLSSDADKLPYFTGSGTAALADFTSFGRSLVDDADASTARTTLGLVIGTDVQAQDEELAAIAGLTSAANTLPYFTGSGTAALTNFSSFGRSLVDDADADTALTTLGVSAFAKTLLDDASESDARSTLGLVIGTDVQAQNAILSDLAGLTQAADKLPYFDSSSTAATTDLTAFGRTLIANSSASDARSDLGLVIGTDVQAQNAVLSDLAGLTQEEDKLPYFDSSSSAATTDLTSFGRTLIANASAADARTDLGLVIGTDVQAFSSSLADFSEATPTKGNLLVGDGSNWIEVGVGTNDHVLTADSAQTAGVKWAEAPGAGGGLSNAYDQFTDGTNVADASGGDTFKFRAGTGVTVTVQSNDETHGDNLLIGLDAELQALAGVTSAADALPYFTGSGTATTTTLSSFGRSIIDDANEAAFKATVNLEIGTDVQAYDALLDSISDLSDPNADRILFWDDSAGDFAWLEPSSDISISGTTIDLAAAATPYGTQEIWIPAAAMVASTTNGAASGSVETTTNGVMIRTWDFDASTQEFVQFSIAMPKQWNEGTVTFIPYWSHAATTTNFGVVWQLQGVAFADSDAMDTAWGSAQTSTDTGGTTNDIFIGPASSAITIAGSPAAGELSFFRIARVPSNGSDTMAIDARLHGIKLIITTDSGNDN